MNAAYFASTPLDDFLAGSGSATDLGQLLQKTGLVGSLFGITVAGGLLVFLAAVHRGRVAEVRLMLNVARAAGSLALVGAVVEIAGSASLLETGWVDALTSSNASAPMMRFLAGVLIALGLIQHTAPVDRQTQTAAAGGPSRGASVEHPDADSAALDDGSHVDVVTTQIDSRTRVTDADAPVAGDDEPTVRWVASSASAFGVGGALLGVLSFGFDGHTVTEGPRLVHAAVNFAHVVAASVWFGGVVALVILWVQGRRDGIRMAPLLLRFSTIATVALIVVTTAGVLMSLMITDSLSEFTGTQWGRALIVKTSGVAVAVALGAYNHFVVVPALERDPRSASMLQRARATVTLEAIVLLFVAVATVFLTFASTN